MAPADVRGSSSRPAAMRRDGEKEREESKREEVDVVQTEQEESRIRELHQTNTSQCKFVYNVFSTARLPSKEGQLAGKSISVIYGVGVWEKTWRLMLLKKFQY